MIDVFTENTVLTHASHGVGKRAVGRLWSTILDLRFLDCLNTSAFRSMRLSPGLCRDVCRLVEIAEWKYKRRMREERPVQ